MKLLIVFILTISSLLSKATTYYFAASGNDANNGTSTSTPWKTINKFNSVFASKAAGDYFLFNRGDSFYGMMKITRSGASGLPMNIGAYGTGANPIITGFATVSTWVNTSTNIWESNVVSTLNACNMVSINGVNTAMGRTPNYPNYYIWNSRSGNTSITSASLNSTTTNWTGAEMAFFTTTYRVNRHPIAAHVGSTLTYTTGTNIDFFQNPGSYFVQNFIIQNDVRTLDTQNEWYYNPSTKKIRVYSSAKPISVQVAAIDTLLYTGINQNYISISNLAFKGCNKDAIELGNGKYITVNNCTFDYIGGDCVFGASFGQVLPGFQFNNCTVNNVNGSGINLSKWFTDNSITHNNIKNIGMNIGMSKPATGNQLATGICAAGPGSTISYNTVQMTGYVGIRYLGNNTLVDHNYINNACYGNGIKDGGALYTAGDGTTVTGMKALYNIVTNTGFYSKGIDCDDRANGIELAYNTAYNTARGIYLHNTWNINIHDNLTFNNTEAELLMVGDNTTLPMKNITIKNNIFVARTTSQKTIWSNTIGTAAMPLPFVSDSNYFARPIDDNLSVLTYFNGVVTMRSLAGWQALNGQDIHSKKSPKTVTSVTELRFESNPSTTNKTISLGATYIDMKGKSYTTITLAPYRSVVLIKTGTTNVSPSAFAGEDQDITI